MQLLLIRHGSVAPGGSRTVDGWPDPDLSDLGRYQAERLGRRLEREPFQRIYASDLRRAAQTAQILALHVPVTCEIRAGLREIHMGRLHDATWLELEGEFPGYFTRWSAHAEDLPYPEGECGADVCRRAMPVIEEILGSGLERVAVVAHGGTIRVLLCAFLGIGQEKRFQFGDPLANCGLSRVHWDEKCRAIALHSINDFSHLL